MKELTSVSLPDSTVQCKVFICMFSSY